MATKNELQTRIESALKILTNAKERKEYAKRVMLPAVTFYPEEKQLKRRNLVLELNKDISMARKSFLKDNPSYKTSNPKFKNVKEKAFREFADPNAIGNFTLIRAQEIEESEPVLDKVLRIVYIQPVTKANIAKETPIYKKGGQ